MRDVFKRLTGESALYGIGQAGSRAVQVLLVPVLTRVLAPDAYGVSELVLAYSQTVLLVLVFGMDGALARFFYQEPDTHARVTMVSSSLAFRLVTGIAAALLLGALAAPLAGGLLGGAVYRKYVLIGACTLPFTLLVLFASDVLRVTFQPLKFVAVNGVQTLLTAGLALYFVVVRDLGVAGVLYGKLAGDAGAALMGLGLARHALAPRLDRTVLARMLRYGLPLVPVSFAFGVIGSLDRWMLQHARSLDEVAVYALAAKFFSVVAMAVTAFSLAFFPIAYARAGQPDAPRLYARVLGAYVAVAGGMALLIASFAPEALALLAPPAYAPAARPALWLCFAAVVQGAYYVAALGLGLALRTPLLAWGALAGALVAALGQFALTPRFGVQGAALATLAAYLVALVVTWVIAQRVYPLPYRGGRLAALGLVAVALAVAAQRLAQSGPLGIAGRLAIVAVFAGLCIGLGVGKDRGAVARGHEARPGA
jgi:O-antigen/teichoic acid export membrane protein